METCIPRMKKEGLLNGSSSFRIISIQLNSRRKEEFKRRILCREPTTYRDGLPRKCDCRTKKGQQEFKYNK